MNENAKSLPFVTSIDRSNRPRAKCAPRHFKFVKIPTAALSADVFPVVAARVGLERSDALMIYLLYHEVAQTADAEDGGFGEIPGDFLAACLDLPGQDAKIAFALEELRREGILAERHDLTFIPRPGSSSASSAAPANALGEPIGGAKGGWEKTPRRMHADARIKAVSAMTGLRRPMVLHVWHCLHHDAQRRAGELSINEAYLSYVTGLSAAKVRAVLKAFGEVGLTADGRDALYDGFSDSTARTRSWRARKAEGATSSRVRSTAKAAPSSGNIINFPAGDRVISPNGASQEASHAASHLFRREDEDSPMGSPDVAALPSDRTDAKRDSSSLTTPPSSSSSPSGSRFEVCRSLLTTGRPEDRGPEFFKRPLNSGTAVSAQVGEFSRRWVSEVKSIVVAACEEFEWPQRDVKNFGMLYKLLRNMPQATLGHLRIALAEANRSGFVLRNIFHFTSQPWIWNVAGRDLDLMKHMPSFSNEWSTAVNLVGIEAARAVLDFLRVNHEDLEIFAEGSDLLSRECAKLVANAPR